MPAAHAHLPFSRSSAAWASLIRAPPPRAPRDQGFQGGVVKCIEPPLPPAPRAGTHHTLADTPIRLLFICNDDDEVAAIRELLGGSGSAITVEASSSVAQGLHVMRREAYDIVLLNDQCAAGGLLDLEAQRPLGGRMPPFVLLTLRCDAYSDLLAVKVGATDCLSRGGLTSIMLERSVRRAVDAHRARFARQEADVRYQMLVESVGAIVWQGNPATLQFTFVSREAEHILGYPIARWTSEPTFWADHIHADDREWAVAFCERATERRAPHTFEYRMIAADGRVIWLRDIVRVVTVAGKEELAGVMVDITRAKEVDERLRIQDRAISAIAEGVLIVDAAQSDFPIVYVNRAFELLTGYSSAEVMGRNCRFLQGPDTDADCVKQVRVAIQEEQPVTVELVNYRKNGVSFWSRLSISPVRDDVGRLTHFVGVVRDVSDAKVAKLKLEAAEAHYRRLVTTSPQTIFALDPQGLFTELNAAGERLLGRTIDDVLGQHYATVVQSADLGIADAAFRQAVGGGAGALEQELRIVRPSGIERLLHIAITGICEDGTMTGVHGLARDITEERAHLRQLRQLGAALENLRDDAISIVDESGRIVYANATHGRFLGYGPADLGTLNVSAFMPDDESILEFRNIVERVRLGKSWSGVIRRRRHNDGRIVSMDTTVGAVEEEGRTLFFVISRDANERHTREQHLRRVERLAGMGTLIAGVAHELNNPLSAILGFAQLLLLDARTETDREDLTTIAREAERMARIVADLRLATRETQEERGRNDQVDLNDVVRHVLKTRAYSLATHNIEVRTDLAEHLPVIVGDRGRVEQMLLNLVVNAEQAMNGDSAERRLIVRTHATIDGCAVHVIDTGPGIPRAQLDRIFDPFFTTKAPGEGTGLGLSLVHGIVREHLGEIRVDSEVGKGAAFRIDLPRAPEALTGVTTAVTRSAATRLLRVLVVDDEDAVRKVVIRFLEGRGHTVDAAADGGEALALLSTSSADYDVIVSDLRMPGLGGDNLLTRLQQQGSPMAQRMIFLTGDTVSQANSQIFADANVAVLAKPVGGADVVRAVEQVAAAPG